MSHYVVDVESDGAIPGDYSMVAFGAVKVDQYGEFTQTFAGLLRPISEQWKPEALAVSGYTREETLAFPDPLRTMEQFRSWIERTNRSGKPIFWADNNGYDWSFINWYFHHFLGENPFGYSSKNINSLYHGAVKNGFKSFKYLRKTKHTHDPVDDAKGNAEALWAIVEMFDIKMEFR